MNQELKQNYRGVYCQCCRQPIPLPPIVMRIESSSNQNDSGLAREHVSRVFSLRCRSCDKEMPYRTSEIAEIEGTPKPRVSRVQGRGMRRTGEMARAANA